MTLGFILVGLRTREKDYGRAYPLSCPDCQTDVYAHAYQWRRWGHVFWVPIFPLGSTKTLRCPVCEHVISLDSDEWPVAKRAADATERYEAGDLDPESYSKRLQELDEALAVEPQHDSGSVAEH